MIFHENRLPGDDSHKISCLICYFLKSGKILNCRLLQIIGGALRVNVMVKPGTEHWTLGPLKFCPSDFPRMTLISDYSDINITP